MRVRFFILTYHLRPHAVFGKVLRVFQKEDKMFSGPWQIVLLLVVIVLVFGSKKLPELARALGKAKGEFKKGTQEGEQLLSEDLTKEALPKAAPPEIEK
jgi:sec-independent protein translocase protein TatA